ncbi:type II toxin-antitoxin system HipA family toxin [Cochlodiniinecator piscidefendens]|uniref:type II toxin-antitoxin system HipA family toxin n=1 Tax=Cochlodiniinecator piscidefendens TaxID=2715756 RepID=UPI00140952C3|nr:type II toxin-antitoxin system HipA family toxin [Cochlodiniinecator piscidefendens]
MTPLVLDVFLEAVQTPVGQLMRHDDGSLAFRYVTDELPHPISLSLPLRTAPYGDAETRGFFSNLLFENAQRDQIMQRYGIDFSDIVGLLYHLGADCPGAISCVPQGAGPAKQPGDLTTDYDVLDDAALHALMTSLRNHQRVPDGTPDPSPVAGVQGKVAVTQLPDGRLTRPKPGLNVPTTHILKVPRRTEMRTVAHEHMLMTIMTQVQNHPVAATEIIGTGNLQGLLITRFDRTITGTQITRLHQEDFCQALGLGPSLKYQRGGTPDRAFSAKAVGALLENTESPGRARQAFLEITLANLMLGNTDNHAKNHALLYTGAHPILAPVYDVVPTVIDSTVIHQLSFDIGTANMTDDITENDITAFAQALGFPRIAPALRRRLSKLMQDIVAQIDQHQGPERKRIGDAIAEQSKWIVAAMGADISVPERDLVVINRAQ